MDIKAIADEIIINFKLHYLNEHGLISRTFPVSGRTIFDNFDDFVPFAIYFNHTDFVLDQIHRLQEFTYEDLLRVDSTIYSYLIDEYIGGLYCAYAKTGDSTTKSLLDQAIAKTISYFCIGDDFRESHDLFLGTTSPFFSPWSAGMLETFLEMRPHFPELSELVKLTVHRWLENRFYDKEGLLPFRSSNHPFFFFCGDFFGRFRRYRMQYPHLDQFPVSTGIQKAKHLLRCAKYLFGSSGHFVQIMKCNTTVIFLLIGLYRLTQDGYYRDHILRWTKALNTKCLKDGLVFGNYYPPDRIDNPTLVNAFIIIDVLCDIYWFVDKKEYYMELACDIAKRHLSTRWPNGLIPMFDNSDRDHIDGQIDFAVSLRRIGELTDDGCYINESSHLIETALILHKHDKGYCTHVNRNGRQIELPINTVDPKYNGLLLKGLVCLDTPSMAIYENEWLWDILKDR